MQRFSTAASAAFLLSAAFAPAADATEFRGTLGGWGYHLSGDLDDRGQHYDFGDDLGLQGRRRRSLQLDFDTPKGWWPDFAASYSQLGARGSTSRTVTIGPITSTRTIFTDADFDGYDLVARYPWRWHSLRLAGGLAVQQLKGDVMIVDSNDSAPRIEHYDEVFPELHVQARWSLGSALALVGTLQGVEYDGSRAVEWRAAAEFRFMQPLLIEFGWQQKRYRIDLTDYELDARLRGTLLRVGFLYR